MASQFDRGDWGIVFEGSNSAPLPTYTDIRGHEQTAVHLDTGVEVVMDPVILSAYFHVGAASRFTLQVDISLSGTMSVDLDLGLKGEVNGGSAFAKLSTFRNDTSTEAATHNFTAAGSYILQTSDLGAVAAGLIAATLNGIADGGVVTVVVRLRVEP